jgi:predicted nucleic acid-binding protein
LALIVDTGPLFAAFDARDPAHEACRVLLSDATEDLVVPSLVLAEVDYWCRRRLKPQDWLTFLEDVVAGAYRLVHPTPTDLERCLELQQTYADLDLGVVDASVIALAERMGEHKLATLDRRHFGTVRPQHVDALSLLPA